MAKTNIKNNTKGKNNMSKGTMPNDKLVRFKLKGNSAEPFTGKATRSDKTVRRLCRMLRNYRAYVHACYEPKLPSALRQSVHYFSVPMTRADSDNAKDKRGLDVSVEQTTE